MVLSVAKKPQALIRNGEGVGDKKQDMILDPQWFNFNAYSDLAFFQIADPDFRIQGFDDRKFKAFYSWNFFLQKLQFNPP